MKYRIKIKFNPFKRQGLLDVIVFSCIGGCLIVVVSMKDGKVDERDEKENGVCEDDRISNMSCTNLPFKPFKLVFSIR